MFKIKVEKSQVELDYQKTINKWFALATKGLEKEVDESKLEFFYTVGFFLPKIEDKRKNYDEMYERIGEMEYPERPQFELSKTRVNLTMKMGNFEISDRMAKTYLPQPILDFITEFTKLKMIVEHQFFANENVRKSIPEFNSEYFNTDAIREQLKMLFGREGQKFDLDAILDKISASGIDSLTKDELSYLKSQSGK
jgi:hypothetical protein